MQDHRRKSTTIIRNINPSAADTRAHWLIVASDTPTVSLILITDTHIMQWIYLKTGLICHKISFSFIERLLHFPSVSVIVELQRDYSCGALSDTVLRHVSVIFGRGENISISIWHAGYGGLELPKYNKNKQINEWLSNSINVPLNAPKKKIHLSIHQFIKSDTNWYFLCIYLAL